MSVLCVWGGKINDVSVGLIIIEKRGGGGKDFVRKMGIFHASISGFPLLYVQIVIISKIFGI